MRKINLRNLGLALGTSLIIAGVAIIPASALASSSTSAANQARLQRIITRGNSEISRRLSSLNGLATKISSTTKLTADDQASLSAEVTTEINGLTTLKTQLDADTTVAAAVTDAQSIITEYRVYALVLPKVNLIKTADDQQVAEGKLATLAANLGTRLAGTTGDPALQSALADMNAKIPAAQGISSSVETDVLALEPSSYTAGELATYRDQLKTAQNDNQAAVNDAKTIIAGLKAQ